MYTTSAAQRISTRFSPRAILAKAIRRRTAGRLRRSGCPPAVSSSRSEPLATSTMSQAVRGLGNGLVRSARHDGKEQGHQLQFYSGASASDAILRARSISPASAPPLSGRILDRRTVTAIASGVSGRIMTLSRGLDLALRKGFGRRSGGHCVSLRARLIAEGALGEYTMPQRLLKRSIWVKRK
jgi:hypothetical protein